MKAQAHKVFTKIAEVPKSIDGVEPVGNGDFIGGSRVGYIYYARAGGHFETLPVTHSEKRIPPVLVMIRQRKLPICLHLLAS